MTLRAYLVTQIGAHCTRMTIAVALGEAGRWDSLPWVPADTAWLTDLAATIEVDSRHTV